MRYYLIAGERSGDLHGSNLISAIKKNDPDCSFRGFGGDLMRRSGMDLVVHYDQMAFMGLAALVTLGPALPSVPIAVPAAVYFFP